MLKILYPILLFAVFASATGVEKKCCAGDNVLKKTLCSDRQNVALNCTSKYLLDGDLDDDEVFEIAENGDLLYATSLMNKRVVVPSSKYCLTNLDSLNGTRVAIVCFESGDYGNGVDVKWYGLRAICGFLSVVFLLATLLVYFLVPNLRDLQGKCIMHGLFALAISMLNLGIVQLSTLPEDLCYFFSFFNYFSFMTTFFWLNVTSFHVWKTVVFPDIIGTDKQWYLIYLLYGYGMPSVLLVILLAAHHAPGEHLKPGMAVHTCWFKGLKETFAYFYGPIAVLLCINLILFIWCTTVLCRGIKNGNETKMKSLRYKVWLYVRLFLIMGLMWLFEVISAGLDNVHHVLNYFWIITDYINVLQGVLVFLLLVVLRKRALRGLANRGLFCIKFPSAWKTLEDQETANEEAETQLSNGQCA